MYLISMHEYFNTFVMILNTTWVYMLNTYMSIHTCTFYRYEYSYEYLFKTYSSSFYGIELWYNIYRNRAFHNVSVGYHKTVKRIAGLCT